MSSNPARKPVHENIAKYVENESKPVSVAEIAQAIGVSHGTALKRAKETRNLGLIDGSKNTPVIGYSINGSVVVITTKKKALAIIQRHKPGLLSRAKKLPLDDVRKLIENDIAHDKFPVNMAWRFEKN